MVFKSVSVIKIYIYIYFPWSSNNVDKNEFFLLLFQTVFIITFVFIKNAIYLLFNKGQKMKIRRKRSGYI